MITITKPTSKILYFLDSDTFLRGLHIVIQTGSPIIYELWDHILCKIIKSKWIVLQDEVLDWPQVFFCFKVHV